MTVIKDGKNKSSRKIRASLPPGVEVGDKHTTGAPYQAGSIDTCVKN